MDELIEEIERHRRFLFESSANCRVGRKKEMIREELADMFKNRIIQEIFGHIETSGELDKAVELILNGNLDPYTACDGLLTKFRQENELHGNSLHCLSNTGTVAEK